MRFRNNYTTLPYILLALSVAFQLLLVCDSIISLLQLNERYSNQYMIAWSLIFTIKVKLYLVFTVLAFVSLLVYYFIRRRYVYVMLCKFHIWLVFAGLVLVPMYDIVLSLFVEKEFQAHSFQVGSILFYDYPFLLSFLFLITANIFFILTMIKSSTLPKSKQENESTGLLDDFAQ